MLRNAVGVSTFLEKGVTEVYISTIFIVAFIDTASDLGHGWTGALPVNHPELLPVSERSHPRVRHQLPAVLRLSSAVDQRD